jgi:hypothetical protein
MLLRHTLKDCLPPIAIRRYDFLKKVKSNTITVQEFHVLQGFLGGDLAFYVLPGLRKAYYSAIRRLAKEDPSSAKMLRTTDPDAFAEDK